MKIEILQVADKGDSEKERFVLKVMMDTNVGEYAVLQTAFYKENVTIKIYHCYWFPNKTVSEGDLIILYTRKGNNGSEQSIDDNSKAHFFYWGIDEPIWNSDDRAPVLLYSPVWESRKPSEI